jgi:serine/threonine protein kinase/Tfp pilus assembly protein PilF
LEPNEDESEDFDAFLESVDVPDRDWQLGHYRILEEVGRGGMGVIYRARHTPSQRVVALKRILNYHSDSQETLVRFQREARAAASLDHPNILPIYDVGVTEDRLPFFTMKFAVGGSLLNAMKTFRDSPRRAAKLISTVAKAVNHAHGQGILHRDLKPGNILLDARGEALVSDFGLAKWLEAGSDLTRTLTVFGTPGYIAPEQAGKTIVNLTPAADIYSLGAILFELLSGRPPFLGEHALAVLRQAAENDAPKLRSIVPKLSRDLETICARCLERDPELRYPSAAALAEDLDHWLEGRPITARPISLPARFYRWALRNPMLAVSFAICLGSAGAIVARQVQSWKLENKIRESERMRNSITVLPFLDLDNAIEESKWTGDFGRELQTALSNIGNARVVPLSAGDQVKAAARDSRTRTVLFGTRRKTDRGIELSFELLTPDGDLLFDRIVTLKEPFDLKQLSGELAPRLFATLSASDWPAVIAAKTDPGLRNVAARELITAGRELTSHYTVRDLDRALSCFEKAFKLEPRSALVHAYLANSAAIRTHYFNDANLLAYAEREVEEALRLAPTSSEVLRVLSGVRYQQGRLHEALEHGLRAIETSAPNGKSVAMLGMLYRELGRPDQAVRWFELAERFDPRPGEYDYHLGDCWAALDDYEKARAAYRRANELRPERSEGLIGLSRLSCLDTDFAQARNLCRQSTKLDPDGADNAQLAAQIEFFARNFSQAGKIYTVLDRKDVNGGGAFYGALSYKSVLGRIGTNGKPSASSASLLRECLAREKKQLDAAPNNPAVLYRISAIESSLGEAEAAIAHLQAAAAAGWIDYRSLSLDPRFDNIADDVRFQSVLGRLKLKIEDLRKAMRAD